MAAENREDSWEGTKALLELLMESSYQVWKKKAQICKEEARYLGVVLRGGTRLLDQSRKEVILRIPQPTRQQVQEFLGATGFCRVWIGGYSQMVQVLCELLTGPNGNSLNWTERQQEAFEALKLAIMSAPALGLPDLAKPFTLYVTEKDKVAMGGLTQTTGTWGRPVAYLLKSLHDVATGWPGCLQAVAVVALLVWEVTKLALGQDLIIKVNTFEVNTLLRENPINGCQHPGLLNTRDCYVKTPMLLLSFVRP